MGYGHVTRMAQIAEQPEFAECKFSFALREVQKADAIPCCQESQLHQAPIILTAMPGASPNFSHMLRRCGWDSLEMASQLLRAWRNLIALLTPDYLLIDHSPAATAAAITMNIPFKIIGNGFEIPKLTTPMQSIQPYADIGHQQLAEADAHIHKIFDGLNKHYGLAEQTISYPNLFNPSAGLIAGHPIMDHYGERGSEWRYLEVQNKANVAPMDLSMLGKRGQPVGYFYIDLRTKNALDNLLLISKEFELFGVLTNCRDQNTLAYLEQQGIHVYQKLLNMEQAMAIADVVIS